MMQKKLGLFAVAMMNVVIVANLQMMTATAVYGYSLISYYLIAAVAFFVPCILIITELSTSYPVTGGSYIWVEKAFGEKFGFFAACLVWISNVIWYPTIFSLLATIVAHLIAPELSENTFFVLGGALILFWGVTLLNIFGIRVSSFVSSLSSIIGVILPSVILIIFALVWVVDRNPTQITFSWTALLPNFSGNSHLAFLTQIVISLIGIEMVTVHMGDIKNPGKTVPKAMAISAVLILLIVILAPFSIALVIPQDKINIVSGVIDALQIFFQEFQISSVIFLGMLALVFIGNLGSTTGWMIGSTRGMQVASARCQMPPFFQKKNRYGAPFGILILEALIFTLSCSLFFFSSISNSYWFLLQLASQISLLYYVLIFMAAIQLKKQLVSQPKAFQIPGKVKGTLVAAILASVTAIFAVILGFFPPDTVDIGLRTVYPIFLAFGIGIIFCLPFLLLKLAKK